MPDNTDLTGTWVGVYYQHNRPYAIVTELVQQGENLTGSMVDQITERSSTVFEIASEVGLAPGADEQIESRLREMFPDTPDEPIRFVTHLPSSSTLDGWINGDRVEWIKSYEGESFGGYQMGDRLIGQTHNNHSVHYRGKLDATRSTIEGRWWIDPTEESGGARAEGSFELRRGTE